MKTIGENLNVIKKEIGQAFKDRNPEPIQRFALAEKAAGVDWIDINLGPGTQGRPRTDGMGGARPCRKWCRTFPLAWTLPTSRPSRPAWPCCKGTALVNSVMARPERYSVMLPMVAKYNADMVALMWGPEGLPRDENERAALAVELVYAMNEAGIPNEKIYVDPIITPLNIQQEQLMANLAFLEMLQDIAPGCQSTNGLSNISNGTPWREPLNQIYMVMLERAGMTTSIVDYEDELLMSIARGERPDLVEVVHKVQDGEITSPDEVDTDEKKIFVRGAPRYFGPHPVLRLLDEYVVIYPKPQRSFFGLLCGGEQARAPVHDINAPGLFLRQIKNIRHDAPSWPAIVFDLTGGC